MSETIFTFISPRGFVYDPLTCVPVRLLGPCFKTGRKCARQKLADPVYLRGDPAFLDRTNERALRTVPVRRTSGSPAAQALKTPEGRAGTERGHLSSTLRPMRTVRLYVLCRQAGRATRLHRVHSADQRSVANPRGAGEMRVRDGTSTRPVRVPRRESGGQSGAPTPSPTLNLPAPSVRGISVYFSAASRPIELSLQSSFQLSLMVLVIYRSRA